MSTGMPAGIWLTKFGVIIRDYFGHVPYHVGSSLTRKDWRDVDVRLILPDDEFADLFGGTDRSAETNPKLAAITLAFAALGKEMTGLPIDFQIQPASWANEKYPGVRSALIEVRPADDWRPTDRVCDICDGTPASGDPPLCVDCRADFVAWRKAEAGAVSAPSPKEDLQDRTQCEWAGHCEMVPDCPNHATCSEGDR